ncbi:MAG TPA: outer membrane beta-barrel protein [Candidatus Acidoferrales bacterium]|nr:outer membrane beta-barrel protein [Candidatus Acidoferrales bacterium]
MDVMKSKTLLPALVLGGLITAPAAMATERADLFGVGLSMTLGEDDRDDKVALSGRYWLSEQTGVQGSVYYRDDSEWWYEATTYELAVKGIFAPVVREHSRLMLSLEAGYANVDLEYDSKWGKQDRNADGWFVYPAIGAEFTLSSLPQLGLNIEIGYKYTKFDRTIEYDNNSLSYSDSGTENQGILGAVGVIYYF